MELYELRDIFLAGGHPSITYNPRDNVELEFRLKNYLESPYKILSVTGLTKSGKTVLCKEVIPDENRIWISGGDVKTDDELWSIINDELQTAIHRRKSDSSSNTTNTQVGGKVVLPFLKRFFRIQAHREKGHRESTKIDESYSRNPKKAAVEGVLNGGQVIVIDDFHYVPPDAQREIITSLKTPVYEGLRVVFLAIPHRGFDVEKAEHDMGGRIEKLELPSWQIDELEFIANHGFSALNIERNRNMIRQFAVNSFGNPNLMQELCLKICQKEEKRKTTKEPTEIRMSRYDPYFREFAVANFDLKKIVANFNVGRKDRVVRKLQYDDLEIDGDIYSMIFLAIRTILPNREIKLAKLLEGISVVCVDEPPKINEVTRALSQIQKNANVDVERPNILEWDDDLKVLHIIDHYFGYFLKWGALKDIDLI